MKVFIDITASVDIITRMEFKKFKGIQVSKTNSRLMSYGTKRALKLDGEFVAQIEAERKKKSSAAGLSRLTEMCLC